MSNKKVLIADEIAFEALKLLKKNYTVYIEEIDPEKLLKIVHDYDAILVRSRTKITQEIINLGVNLKVIGRAGIGVDNIDIKTATKNGIPVVFAPRGSTVSVAEIAIGQMIALARKLVTADQSMRSGFWSKNLFLGTELANKTIGLIGLGRIGIEVAKRCKVFEMNVIAYDPYINPEVAKKHNIKLVEKVNQIFIQSDFISIHAVLTDETKDMIGKEEFDLMKSNLILINYSRGGIIQEEELIKALESGNIGGAALDVFSTEPLPKTSILRKNITNLHLSPHIGASTKEAQIKAGKITIKGIIDVLNGRKPEYCINREVFK